MLDMAKVTSQDIDCFEKCKKYTVNVVDLNQVGLAHAYLFSDTGFKTIGTSTDPHTLKKLKESRTSYTTRALRKYTLDGSFVALPNHRKAASESHIIVIASQPILDRKRKPDYSPIERTCKDVGMGLKQGSLIIFVNTTGPGKIEGSLRTILEKTSGLQAGAEFYLACSPYNEYFHNPLNTHMHPRNFYATTRVLGAYDVISQRTATLILGKITKSEVRAVSNIRTAEAINLFQQANRSVKLALTNEFAYLCEELGIDLVETLNITEKDTGFHLPSPGGMRDLTRRDLGIFLAATENISTDLSLLPSAKEANNKILDHAFHLIKDAVKACGKTLRRAKISVLGVSQSRDVKEPPNDYIKSLVAFLKRKVGKVQVYDPFFSKKELIELGFEADKLSKVLEGSDCLAILVGHSKFTRLSLKRVKMLAHQSLAIVDLGHVIDPKKAEKNGFVYRGLGRGVWTR
jgi:nucleotide sugar dehydrogenase